MPTITMLYAGIFGLMAVVIAAFPGIRRGKLNISVGHGGDTQLELGMRRHANFVEAVPLALILLGLIEMNGASPLGLHILGSILVVARVAHGVGMKPDTAQNPLRGLGAGGSALVTVAASLWAIWLFVQHVV